MKRRKDRMLAAIARGVCSFSASIDRDIEGHGRITSGSPIEPCPEPCGYCRQLAEHILNEIEEDNVCK